MLKIWYLDKTDTNEKELMIDAPAYFNNVYEDEWLEDEFVKAMIEDVDQSKVVSPRIIESPVLGGILPQELSGGVKVLILLLKDDSFMYNISNCGDNCAKWLLEIGKQGDYEVYLEHIMCFPENSDFEIQLMNSGKTVRTKEEYILELSYIRERLENEGKV